MQNHEALNNLLCCARDKLVVPVCRSFINPGGNAPHDVCTAEDGKDGQLWVANLSSSGGWPSVTSNPITCAVPFAEVIEIGIVRCTKSDLQDTEFLPDPEDITADAIQQQKDKDALKAAILCCWEIDGKDMLSPLWEPIEPQGGCVGGTWTVTIRNASCDCNS